MVNCHNKINGMEISKELKSDIELSQNQLKSAILNHQSCLSKLKADPSNADLQKDVNQAEEQIICIGLEQKNVLAKLREEYKSYQKSLRSNVIKNGIEERRFNLTNALNRARKQNIAVTRSASATSFSDESVENVSPRSSPEHHHNPVEPHDVSQSGFLTYFGLATHEVYKEMQNKRAERKRRSTANPHFLYGNKGWDILTNNKRKRNSAFLISPISPPHTRQSVRKKQERSSPPISTHTALKSEDHMKPIFSSFPAIPNLPSGLIIERVSPGSLSPDSRACIICKQPGALTVCEACSNGFHISCHNRPLAQAPRQCPRCICKETKTVGSLNVPSGMSVSYVTPSEVSVLTQHTVAELGAILLNRHLVSPQVAKPEKSDQVYTPDLQIRPMSHVAEAKPSTPWGDQRRRRRRMKVKQEERQKSLPAGGAQDKVSIRATLDRRNAPLI